MIVRFLVSVTFGLCAIDVVSNHDPSAFVRWSSFFTLLVAAAGACGLLDGKYQTARVEVLCPKCGRDVLDPRAAYECDHPFRIEATASGATTLTPLEKITFGVRATPGRKPEHTRTGWSA